MSHPFLKWDGVLVACVHEQRCLFVAVVETMMV